MFYINWGFAGYFVPVNFCLISNISLNCLIYVYDYGTLNGRVTVQVSVPFLNMITIVAMSFWISLIGLIRLTWQREACKTWNVFVIFFLIGIYCKLAVCTNKIKKFPHLCSDLNPRPLVYESRTISQDHLGRWVWRVLKFVLNKAWPIISK